MDTSPASTKNCRTGRSGIRQSLQLVCFQLFMAGTASASSTPRSPFDRLLRFQKIFLPFFGSFSADKRLFCGLVTH